MLIRIGAVVAGVGVVAALVALLPLVLSGAPTVAPLWFVAVGGVAVGVALVLLGLVRSARSRGRYLRGS